MINEADKDRSKCLVTLERVEEKMKGLMELEDRILLLDCQHCIKLLLAESFRLRVESAHLKAQISGMKPSKGADDDY